MPPSINLTMTALRHRLHLRLAEWANAVAMTLCGLILLQPGATFDLRPYSALRELMTEHQWGVTLTVIGGLRLLVLAINGLLPRGSPHLRFVLAVVSCALWTGMLTGYLGSHVPSLMIAMTATAMAAEFVSIARTAGAAATENDEHRSGRHGWRT